MRTFEISGPFIELHKLLKASGLAESGGQAKLLISEGRVWVNGSAEKVKGRKLRERDTVSIDGETIEIKAKGRE